MAIIEIMAMGRIELGPTGRAVAANVKRLRAAKGMSLRALSEALEAKGRRLNQDAINKIENGADPDSSKGVRRVDADDLAALAAVFGVSPSSLLLPMTAKPADPVAVTGEGEMPADQAWAWAHGKRPLHLTADHEQTELMEHQLFGLPQWLREPTHLILRGDRSADQLHQARQKYELLASIGGASLNRLRELDPEAFEDGGDG